MLKDSVKRRDFLKKMLTASVLTSVCPHTLLGKSEPIITKWTESVQGIFVVKLSQFPDLKEMWKSVRMSVDCIPPEEKFPKILICKVERTMFGVDYTAVLEICPHQGHWVKDLHPVYHDYECTGHGTLFDASGTYKEGPAAQDLVKFPVVWDGDDDLLIEIPGCVSTSVSLDSENLFYFKEIYPNPCSDFALLDFGVEEPSSIIINVFDVYGRQALPPVEYHLAQGHFKKRLDVAQLPIGIYMCELLLNGVSRISRTISIAR